MGGVGGAGNHSPVRPSGMASSCCRPGMCLTSQLVSTAPLRTSRRLRASWKMAASTATHPLPGKWRPSHRARVSGYFLLSSCKCGRCVEPDKASEGARVEVGISVLHVRETWWWFEHVPFCLLWSISVTAWQAAR